MDPHMIERPWEKRRHDTSIVMDSLPMSFLWGGQIHPDLGSGIVLVPARARPERACFRIWEVEFVARSEMTSCSPNFVKMRLGERDNIKTINDLLQAAEAQTSVDQDTLPYNALAQWS